MSYKPTNAVLLDLPPLPKKPRKKKLPKGIVVPKVLTPDTGIHAIRQLAGEGDRYRLWYHIDGKRKYLALPRGTSLDEARVRRDHLFRNLRTKYDAKTHVTRTFDKPRKDHATKLTPELYICRQDPFVIRVMGKEIGTAKTWKQAEQVRNRWLKSNAEKVPHLTRAIAEL